MYRSIALTLVFGLAIAAGFLLTRPATASDRGVSVTIIHETPGMAYWYRPGGKGYWFKAPRFKRHHRFHHRHAWRHFDRRAPFHHRFFDRHERRDRHDWRRDRRDRDRHWDQERRGRDRDWKRNRGRHHR